MRVAVGERSVETKLKDLCLLRIVITSFRTFEPGPKRYDRGPLLCARIDADIVVSGLTST